MSNNQSRRRFAIAILGICSITFVGGCSYADPATFETFVADLLRSLASALVL